LGLDTGLIILELVLMGINCFGYHSEISEFLFLSHAEETTKEFLSTLKNRHPNIKILMHLYISLQK